MSKEQELLVECPFFRKQKGKFVECEGMDNHSVIRSHYRKPGDMKEQMTRYCCSMEYEKCPLGKMLFAKYGY